MPYNEVLAKSVREILSHQNKMVKEKKMMGGLTFMVNGKMCVGIIKNDLMARIAPEKYEAALNEPDTRPMDFTGKPMKGYIYIDSNGTSNMDRLKYWIAMALEFNDRAISYKSKKRK